MIARSEKKNAEEAHEAIRPAKFDLEPNKQPGLSSETRKLYELIWRRTLASQMADALTKEVSLHDLLHLN